MEKGDLKVVIVVGVLVGIVLVRKDLSSLGIFNLPLLIHVLLVGFHQTDLEFVFALDLFHGQSLVGGNGDDLIFIPLSFHWGEFPLSLGAVRWLVHLGNDFVVSIIGNDLDFTLFLLIEGKTVEFIISADLCHKDLVPGLFWVFLEADDGRLVFP